MPKYKVICVIQWNHFNANYVNTNALLTQTVSQALSNDFIYIIVSNWELRIQNDLFNTRFNVCFCCCYHSNKAVRKTGYQTFPTATWIQVSSQQRFGNWLKEENRWRRWWSSQTCIQIWSYRWVIFLSRPPSIGRRATEIRKLVEKWG